jgi:hypothetical protein
LASSAKASASPPPGAPTAGAEAAHAYGAETPGRWLAWGKWSTFSSMDWFKGNLTVTGNPMGKWSTNRGFYTSIYWFVYVSMDWFKGKS